MENIKNVIRITDKKDEQVAIGKLIVNGNPNIYSGEVVCSIKDIIKKSSFDKNMVTSEELFYISIYDYWAYGVNTPEEIFYSFYKKTDKEKKSYLTFRSRFEYVYKLNDIKDKHILNNKYETYQILKQYYKRDVIQVKSEDDRATFTEFVKKHNTFVFKPIELGLGIGIKKISLGDSTADLLFDKLIKEGKEIKKNNSWRGWDTNSAIVLEECIKQSEAMAKLNPDSINSLRIPTIRKGGRVDIWRPYMKIGLGTEYIVDEAFSLIAGVDKNTGVLDTHAYDELGNEYDIHPHSGCEIMGYEIPQWNELLEIAKKVALMMPKSINYVGWDFILSDKGWVIIEGNFDGEFLGQNAYQCGLRYELEELTDFKVDDHFWWDR